MNQTKTQLILQFQGQRFVLELQHQIRQNADAIATSIVLEQGKTWQDAHGDILRGLQVVETAAGIPTSMMGQKLEGTPEFPSPRKSICI